MVTRPHQRRRGCLMAGRHWSHEAAVGAMAPRGQAAVQVQAGGLGSAVLQRRRPAIAPCLVGCERPGRAEGCPEVQVGVRPLLHCWPGRCPGFLCYPGAVVPPVVRAGACLVGCLLAAPQTHRPGLQLYAVRVCALVPPPLASTDRGQDRLSDAGVDPSGAGQEGGQLLCKSHVVAQPRRASFPTASTAGMPPTIQGERQPLTRWDRTASAYSSAVGTM